MPEGLFGLGSFVTPDRDREDLQSFVSGIRFGTNPTAQALSLANLVALIEADQQGKTRGLGLSDLPFLSNGQRAQNAINSPILGELARSLGIQGDPAAILNAYIAGEPIPDFDLAPINVSTTVPELLRPRQPVAQGSTGVSGFSFNPSPGGGNVTAPFDFGGGSNSSTSFNFGSTGSGSFGLDPFSLGGSSSGGGGSQQGFFGEEILRDIGGVLSTVLGGIFGNGDDDDGIVGTIGNILGAVLGGGQQGNASGVLNQLLGALGGLLGGGQAQGGALLGGLLAAFFGDKLNETRFEQRNRLPAPGPEELELLGINTELARRQLQAFGETQGTQGIQNQALQTAVQSLSGERGAANAAANEILRQRAGLGAPALTPSARADLGGDLRSILESGQLGLPIESLAAAQAAPDPTVQASNGGAPTLGDPGRQAIQSVEQQLGRPLSREEKIAVAIRTDPVALQQLNQSLATSLGASADLGGIAALRGQEAAGALGDSEFFRGVEREATQRVLEQLQRGGVADPETVARIAGIADLATSQGLSDLDRFGSDIIEQIRLASARRGLRPSDTPTVNRLDDTGAELVRNAQQLISGIRQSQLAQELNFPLQQGSLGVSQLGQLSSTSQGARQLGEALSRSGDDRLLGIGGQAANTGLGLSASSRPTQTLGLLQENRGRQGTIEGINRPSDLESFSNTTGAAGSILERLGLFGG